MDALGQRIKKLRVDKGISQADLGKLVNVGNTTVSQWESNRRVPDIGVVKRLAEIFGVSVDFLLGNEKADDLPETVAPYLADGLKELTPEARKEVMDFIEYVKVKYAKKEGDDKK